MKLKISANDLIALRQMCHLFHGKASWGALVSVVEKAKPSERDRLVRSIRRLCQALEPIARMQFEISVIQNTEQHGCSPQSPQQS